MQMTNSQADTSIVNPISAPPSFRAKARTILRAIGYDTTDWVRVVMYQKCFAFIRSLGPERLDVFEVSGGPQWRREFNFKRYETTNYPGFDITRETLPRQFDLIIADQVFEHLQRPQDAAKNVFAMLKPGGYFVVSTPFLIRVHASPIDCNRWTEEGMTCLLEGAGFERKNIKTEGWGNRACLKANLNRWRKRGFFGSLKNEANFPVMIWAFARRPLDS